MSMAKKPRTSSPTEFGSNSTENQGNSFINFYNFLFGYFSF